MLTALTVILVYLSILPILYLSPWVEKAKGKLGVMVIARILCIFICAKAVSLVLSGLHINLYKENKGLGYKMENGYN